MDTVSASEARQITSENLKGPAIESFVSTLSARIRKLASEGKSSFDPWGYLGTLRGIAPTHDEREAIRKHFERKGFEWVDHADPGHPCSRPYTTISWS